MKLKGWGIAPFKLIDFYVDAMSSRLLLRRSTTTPRYSLVLEGSLEFNLSATSDSEYHWVTITNSGRLPLTGLTCRYRQITLRQMLGQEFLRCGRLVVL